MAIACFRLFTFPPFPPLPLRNVPFLRRFIALSTRLPAALPYFRVLFFFRVAMCPRESEVRCNEARCAPRARLPRALLA